MASFCCTYRGVVNDGDDAVVVGVGKDDPEEGEEADAVETVNGLGTPPAAQHLGHVGQQRERFHQPRRACKTTTD